MRSLLIAPADEKRLAEALKSGADAIIVDLARAARADRVAARALAAGFIKETRGRGGRPALIVRTHALDSGETDSDLDVVMAHAPDAILLPRSLGAASVQQLSAKLAVREAEFALPDGGTRIIAVADTARSLFGMGSYRGSSARLSGIAWSAQSLRADIGAETDRNGRGDYAGPYRLARDLTLLAGWRRSTRRLPTSATRRVCAPKRSPRGAPALPAKWRSTRPRWASSTRYSRRDDDRAEISAFETTRRRSPAY
jgi:citrate lyase subunit beta/citryl-CoA lyase